MAIPPRAGLEDDACCDWAVVRDGPLAVAEGTLRGVTVFAWPGLLLDSGVCTCLLRKLALFVFGVVMALLSSRSELSGAVRLF
jgi:hypothetical protein